MPARSRSTNTLRSHFGSGGDIDHVGLGPVAVAIETKAGRGAVGATLVRDGNADVSLDGTPIKVGPVGQAVRAAENLEAIWGVPVTPVVCLVDATSGPIRIGGAWVCNADDLPSVVASAEPALRDGDVPAVMAATVEPPEPHLDEWAGSSPTTSIALPRPCPAPLTRTQSTHVVPPTEPVADVETDDDEATDKVVDETPEVADVGGVQSEDRQVEVPVLAVT